MFYFSLILFLTIGINHLKANVHEHGYWYGEEILHEHKFDPWLANALAQFFLSENAQTIVDFGCGLGHYVKYLQAHDLDCEGYDGNPDTPSLTGGACKVLDLSQPVDLQRRYDWVLSLETGEHIPKPFEKTFIETLHYHNVRGIILSWAVKGQGGFGHFNEQNNDYVKHLMSAYGYVNDVQAEQVLRNQASLWWFKNTIMVFRKESKS